MSLPQLPHREKSFVFELSQIPLKRGKDFYICNPFYRSNLENAKRIKEKIARKVKNFRYEEIG